MFISFEGVEGSGKSTQMQRLAEFLRRRGREVLCTYEPGGTPVGDAVRRILLDPNTRMEPGTELFLMMSSRRELVERVIRPALAEGTIVLSDRFVDASFAYQGYGRQLGLEMVDSLAKWACGDCRPERTLLFDIDAAKGLSRSLPLEKKESEAGRGDRIESCGAEFLEKVRQGYLELARQEPGRFIVIPVTGGEEETYKVMISRLRPLLESGSGV